MNNPFDNFGQNISDAFTNYPISAIFDILIFALVLYAIFAFLKKNGATKLIFVFVPALVIIVTVGLQALGFILAGRILRIVIVFAFFAAILLFPQQSRRFLWKLSAKKENKPSFNAKYDITDDELFEAIENIVRASQNLAKKNIGALIVIAPEGLPSHILESGTQIGGKVSSALLETIFNEKTPLHDGAVCITGNKILAASCFLPLSQDLSIDKELGTRHRAAVGATENYRVLSVIVSEETGVISTAQNGELERYYNTDMLREVLMQIYGLKMGATEKNTKQKKKKGRER